MHLIDVNFLQIIMDLLFLNNLHLYVMFSFFMIPMRIIFLINQVIYIVLLYYLDIYLINAEILHFFEEHEQL